MRCSKAIGTGMLALFMFGCGATETTEPGGIIESVVTESPTQGKAVRDDMKTREAGLFIEPVSRPGQKESPKAVKKAELEKAAPVAAVKTGSSVPRPSQPKRTSSPTIVTEAETPPSPPPEPLITNEPVLEEAPRAAMEPSGDLEQVIAPAVLIPPSPPRRVSPPKGSPSGPTVVKNSVTQSEIRSFTLPAGSVIEIRTIERISSETNVSGDSFGATLTRDVEAGGEVLFRRGSDVKGRLIEVLRPGKVKGRGSVTFTLQAIGGAEGEYPLETNAITIEAESSKGKDAAKVGAATAIGAVLGAVFGGKKGAAVGSATGGAAGTAGVLLSRGKEVEIPAERLFSFRLEEAVEVVKR